MRWAPFAKQIGTGKEWLKFDLQELGEQQGFDIGALTGSQGDPTQQLDQLRAAKGAVEVLGEEKVRDEQATHYKATIDLRRYAEQAPPGDRERVRRSIERLIELTGTNEAPTEVWIGHDSHRIRRMRVKSRYKVPQGVGEIEQDMTIELFGFGWPVERIEPPPAAETADLAERARR